MFNYPAKFAREADGGFSVTFRDIPEAITQGDTFDEAKLSAVDALVTAMDFYFEDSRQVPTASKKQDGEELIELPTSISTKVLLLNSMIENKVKPVELARSMKIKRQEVNRIMDIHHSTKIDTLAAAFNALGKKLEFHVSSPQEV